MKGYRHMLGRMVSGVLLAGAFVVLSAARADAGLIVWVCNDAACVGGGDTVILDNGAGDANNTVAGQITAVVAGVGIELATTYPAVGTPSQPYLNLTYSVNDFALLPTPFLYAAQDGFTFAGNLRIEANASDGGGLVNVYAGAGAFNPALPGVPIFACAMDCLGTAPAPGSPYYLAIGVRPTPSGLGSASGDVTITAVPDGGSTAVLLGSVLFAFGALRRKFSGR